MTQNYPQTSKMKSGNSLALPPVLIIIISVNNPRKILQELDNQLARPTGLILYGRGALAMAYPDESGWQSTMDVDVIIPSEEESRFDQDEQFWTALELANQQLDADGLYLTHLFLDEQIILSPDWRSRCVPIRETNFKHLSLGRPSTQDLILTKMMRVDPQDREDVLRLLQLDPPHEPDWKTVFQTARVPDSHELRVAFEENKAWFFKERLHEITR